MSNMRKTLNVICIFTLWKNGFQLLVVNLCTPNELRIVPFGTRNHRFGMQLPYIIKAVKTKPN